MYQVWKINERGVYEKVADFLDSVPKSDYSEEKKKSLLKPFKIKYKLKKKEQSR